MMQHGLDQHRPIRRLGVIGDVHGEHERLETVLEWFAAERLDAVICTGDIADGRGCINRSCALLHQGGVRAVAGNHDRWLLQDRARHVADAHRVSELDADSLAFLQSLPRSLELETVAGKLLLCHGVGDNDLGKVWPGTRRSRVRRSTELDRLLSEGRHRFIVNGHLHFRVLIDFERALLLNAGTLKGEQAGVAIIDFESGWVRSFHVEAGQHPAPAAEHALMPDGRRRVWRDSAAFDGCWEPVLL